MEKGQSLWSQAAKLDRGLDSKRREYHRDWKREYAEEINRERRIARKADPNISKRHHQKYGTSQEAKAAARKRFKLRLSKRQELLASWKDKPCADCGQKYHRCCMDFDHGDNEKSLDIGKCFATASLEKLIREVAKCDVVCANCHRMRTWNRREYTK